MRVVVATILAAGALGGSAQAQSQAGTGAPSRGYVEGVAQAAFSDVTSQSFGGEIGFAVRPGLSVFLEGGYVRDAAPTALGAAAQTLAAGVTVVAGPTTFQVKEPVAFGDAGFKYVFPVSSSVLEPYVLAGGGVAVASKDVSFSTPSGDITQFATLGSDLSGNETAGMVTVGGGVAWLVSRKLFIDLQYRFGHVFTTDGLNINRAGAGIGVRF